MKNKTTVKDLIKMLQKLPNQNALVVHADEGGVFPAEPSDPSEEKSEDDNGQVLPPGTIYI